MEVNGNNERFVAGGGTLALGIIGTALGGLNTLAGGNGLSLLGGNRAAADDSRIAKLEAERAKARAEAKKAAQAVADKLAGLTVTVNARTVDGTKLYGSVSATDLLAAIEADRGVKLERNQLELDDNLKEVGVFEPVIDLGQGVTVKFKITILDEEAAAE